MGLWKYTAIVSRRFITANGFIVYLCFTLPSEMKGVLQLGVVLLQELDAL
jgi:hypothetical protein